MPHSDHSNSPPVSSFSDLPPFPDTVSTAPLLRISLSKLLVGDAEEEQRCWKACCDLGFFYLDLRTPQPQDATSDDGVIAEDTGETLLQDAERLFEVMKGFFELDVTEKIKYDFANQGSYFGYKGYGAGIIDKEGTKDRNEFYNISKDDILGLSPALSSPSVLNTHRNLYTSYIRSSHQICMLIATILSSRLALTSSAREAGGLPALHKLDSISGDQIRFVRAPPQEQDLKGVALGEHTDFGSVTILFNRLGGLQVRLPSGLSADPGSFDASTTTATSTVEQSLCQDGWTYVRPLPGHCIVNLGDAMVKFSEGVLRSNIHRVVAPPGDQGAVTRYSLVYFCRPEDDVILRSLVSEKVGNDDGGGEEEQGVTAKEWILRRALGRRKADGWEGSNGTEKASMREGVSLA